MAKQLQETLQEQLFQREMTRRQFLQFMGLGVVSIFGLGNLVSYLLKLNAPAQPKDDAKKPHGFGASKFGV